MVEDFCLPSLFIARLRLSSKQPMYSGAVIPPSLSGGTAPSSMVYAVILFRPPQYSPVVVPSHWKSQSDRASSGEIFSRSASTAHQHCFVFFSFVGTFFGQQVKQIDVLGGPEQSGTSFFSTHVYKAIDIQSMQAGAAVTFAAGQQ